LWGGAVLFSVSADLADDFSTASNFFGESLVVLLPLGGGEVLQLVGEAGLLPLDRRDGIPKGSDFIRRNAVIAGTTNPVHDLRVSNPRAFAGYPCGRVAGLEVLLNPLNDLTGEIIRDGCLLLGFVSCRF